MVTPSLQTWILKKMAFTQFFAGERMKQKYKNYRNIPGNIFDIRKEGVLFIFYGIWNGEWEIQNWLENTTAVNECNKIFDLRIK